VGPQPAHPRDELEVHALVEAVGGHDLLRLFFQDAGKYARSRFRTRIEPLGHILDHHFQAAEFGGRLELHHLLA